MKTRFQHTKRTFNGRNNKTMNKQQQNHRLKRTGHRMGRLNIFYWPNFRLRLNAKFAWVAWRFPNLCDASSQRNNQIKLTYIEDISFFEVNTKYSSLSVLKPSEFSRVRSTSGNFDVCNSRDEIYLVFTEKSKFSFYFTLFRRVTVNLLIMFQAKSQ